MKSAMSLYAKPAHKAVARHLGHTLTLGDELAWHGYSIVLRARLIMPERAALAFSALHSLNDDLARTTCEARFGVMGAGMPQAPLFSYMDQAAFWADLAEPDELDAYSLAGINRMRPARRAALLKQVQARQAA